MKDDPDSHGPVSDDEGVERSGRDEKGPAIYPWRPYFARNSLRSERELAPVDVAILIPKTSARDPDFVVSNAALNRRNLAASARTVRGHAKASKLQVWKPQRDPLEVLLSAGYEERSGLGRGDIMDPDYLRKGVVERLPNLGSYVVYQQPGQTTADLIEQFGGEFIVAKDQPITMSSPTQDGDGHCALGDGHVWAERTGIARAHEMGVKGRSVRFGMLDTGIDADHAEFGKQKIPFCYVPYRENVPLIDNRMGFDPYGHGTHVGSILVGNKVGVAPDARLIVAGVLEGRGDASTLRRIIQGMDWLYGQFTLRQNIGKPLILNLSIGFEPHPPQGQDPSEYTYSMAGFQRSIENMFDGNVLVVSAIGNDGEHRFRMPAGTDEVFSVGAVDEIGEEIMEFSGNVPDSMRQQELVGPDIVGFGSGVIGAAGRTVTRSHEYERRTGTSQAAPYVAGIAGLYWSMDRRMPADEVRDLVLATAEKVPRGEPNHRWGGGLARFEPPPELVKQFTGS